MARLTDAEKVKIDEMLQPIDAKVSLLRNAVQQGQRSQSIALAVAITQAMIDAVAVIAIDVTDD